MCNQLTDREEKVGCFHSSNLFHLYPFLIPLSLRQLYHNTLELKECDHTNAAAAKATSALETQNKNKATNEYSQPRSATESKELETSAEEEKLVKPDAQQC